MTGRVRGVVGIAVGSVSAVAIVLGLWQAGSPGAARAASPSAGVVAGSDASICNRSCPPLAMILVTRPR